MTPTVLISQKVVAECGSRLIQIRDCAPRKIEVIEFTPELVLACPLTPETHGLMDVRRFALLPRHAGFINISRGAVVDETALIDALINGRLKGAYLDVFAVEPLPADSPLWDLSNVILTPHDATASAGNYARGVELFLRNLEAYLRGAALENEVYG